LISDARGNLATLTERSKTKSFDLALEERLPSLIV
jgi:hypothetical protein